MAKPKLSDLLKGATGGSSGPLPQTPVEPVAPGSAPPVVTPSAKMIPAAGGVPIRPARRVPTQEEIRAQTKRLLIRNFVRMFLTPGDTFMNASECYRRVNPDADDATAKREGWRLTQDQDVKDEYARQLRAIDKAADLDDQWVYDRWRAIANASIFDYIKVDPDTGVVDYSNLDPSRLTPEQQMCIREIRIDPRTGRLVNLKLASVDMAVANVAKARQMIAGKRDLAQVDLAQRITERMNRAAKRIGRTFDESGEQV